MKPEITEAQIAQRLQSAIHKYYDLVGDVPCVNSEFANVLMDEMKRIRAEFSVPRLIKFQPDLKIGSISVKLTIDPYKG